MRSNSAPSITSPNRSMPTTSLPPCSRSTTRRSSRRRIRCRRTACAGSTSSASTNCAGATFRKPRAASACTAALCSVSSPSARPNESLCVTSLPFRFVDAVPVRRRRVGAVPLNALDIHVVEASDAEAVGELAAAIDQALRFIPLLLAVRRQHRRVQIAQVFAARVVVHFGPAEHGEHHFGLLFAFYLDEVDLHGGELRLRSFGGARADHH